LTQRALGFKLAESKQEEVPYIRYPLVNDCFKLFEDIGKLMVAVRRVHNQRALRVVEPLDYQQDNDLIKALGLQVLVVAEGNFGELQDNYEHAITKALLAHA
jgi:hypothetical protein